MTTKSRSELRRLDAVVAELTALTRSQARALILAGKVRIDDEPSTKPGLQVPDAALVTVEEAPKYVGRGGLVQELGPPLHQLLLRSYPLSGQDQR